MSYLVDCRRGSAVSRLALALGWRRTWYTVQPYPEADIYIYIFLPGEDNVRLHHSMHDSLCLWTDEWRGRLGNKSKYWEPEIACCSSFAYDMIYIYIYPRINKFHEFYISGIPTGYEFLIRIRLKNETATTPFNKTCVQDKTMCTLCIRYL